MTAALIASIRKAQVWPGPKPTALRRSQVSFSSSAFSFPKPRRTGFEKKRPPWGWDGRLKGTVGKKTLYNGLTHAGCWRRGTCKKTNNFYTNKTISHAAKSQLNVRMPRCSKTACRLERPASASCFTNFSDITLAKAAKFTTALPARSCYHVYRRN